MAASWLRKNGCCESVGRIQSPTSRAGVESHQFGEMPQGCFAGTGRFCPSTNCTTTATFGQKVRQGSAKSNVACGRLTMPVTVSRHAHTQEASSCRRLQAALSSTIFKSGCPRTGTIERTNPNGQIQIRWHRRNAPIYSCHTETYTTSHPIPAAFAERVQICAEKGWNASPVQNSTPYLFISVLRISAVRESTVCIDSTAVFPVISFACPPDRARLIPP